MIDPQTSLILSSDRQGDAARSQDVAGDQGIFSAGALFAHAMDSATRAVMRAEAARAVDQKIIDQKTAEKSVPQSAPPERPSYADWDDHRHDHQADYRAERESHRSETRLDHKNDDDQNRHDHQPKAESSVHDSPVDHSRIHRLDDDRHDDRPDARNIAQEKGSKIETGDAVGRTTDRTGADTDFDDDASVNQPSQSANPDASDTDTPTINPVTGAGHVLMGDGSTPLLPEGERVVSAVDGQESVPLDTPVVTTSHQVSNLVNQGFEDADTAEQKMLDAEHDLVNQGFEDADAGIIETGLSANDDADRAVRLDDTGLSVGRGSESTVADSVVVSTHHANLTNVVSGVNPTIETATGNGVDAANHDPALSSGIEAVDTATLNLAAEGDLPNQSVGNVSAGAGPATDAELTHQGSIYQESMYQELVNDGYPVADQAVGDAELNPVNQAIADATALTANLTDAEKTNTATTDTVTSYNKVIPQSMTADRASGLSGSVVDPALSPDLSQAGHRPLAGDSAVSIQGSTENSARTPDTVYHTVAGSLRPLSHFLQRGLTGNQNIRNQGLDVRLQVTSENGIPPRPVHTLATALVAQEIPHPIADTRSSVLEGALQQRMEGSSSKASGAAEQFLSSVSSPTVGSKVTAKAGTGSGSQVSGSQTSGIQISGPQGLANSPHLSAVSSSSGPIPAGGSATMPSSPLMFPFIPNSALPTNATSRSMPLSLPHQAALREQVAVHIHKAAAKGMDRVSIQLKPAELGRVEVHMDMRADYRTTVTVLVERPETLDLLQRDARGLEQSLRDAGLKTDGGSLQFSLRGERDGGDSSKKGDGQDVDPGQVEKNGNNQNAQEHHAIDAASAALALNGSSEGRLNLVV